MEKQNLHYPDLFHTMVKEINAQGGFMPTTTLSLMFDARAIVLMEDGTTMFWSFWGKSIIATMMFDELSKISDKCTNVYEIYKENDKYSIKRVR